MRKGFVSGGTIILKDAISNGVSVDESNINFEYCGLGICTATP
jgi:hypothetical protein